MQPKRKPQHDAARAEEQQPRPLALVRVDLAPDASTEEAVEAWMLARHFAAELLHGQAAQDRPSPESEPAAPLLPLE